MRVAIVGDIGQRVYHVGDEAMTHAVGHALEQRGHTPVYLTRDVEDTRRRFGAHVEASRTLVFPWPPADRVRYLGEIRDVLAGRTDALPAHDQIFAFVDHVSTCDALVVAGGGNMSSRYGWLLYERLAALTVADVIGLPSFVTGQTLGPAISTVDATNAARGLGLALGFAARESASADLARRLLPSDRVHTVLDDASFFSEVTLPSDVDVTPSVPVVAGAIVATIAPQSLGWSDRLLPGLASALDDLAARSGAPVHLVPHMAREGKNDGDLGVHSQIAAAARGDVTALPLEHAVVAARRAREAGLVLTSRYHPAVFALEGGVPVLGLAPDEFTRVRLAGALANWGIDDGALLPVERLDEAGIVGASAATWEHREGIRAALRAVRETLHADEERFWDEMVDALDRRHAPRPHRLVQVPRVPVRGELARLAVRPAHAPPVVSIVMRTKDRASMLARALDDVASQTFDDLEVVVVNDGGDPTPVDRIVEECIGLAGRARVLHRATSTGMEAASNAGLRLARGEYVVVHDDDDTWDPRFLAETVGFLTAHPEHRAVAGRTEIVWEVVSPDAPLPVVESREPFHGDLNEITIADELRINHVVPIALVYRRAVHNEIGYYDESLPVVGDWEFNLRLTRLGPIPVIGLRSLAFWHQRRQAEGALANSVIGQRTMHTSQDRLVRDARLREHLDKYGDGGLLFLSGYLEDQHTATLDRIGELEARLTRKIDIAVRDQTERLRVVEDRLRDAGLVGQLVRMYQGIRRRAQTAVARRRPS